VDGLLRLLKIGTLRDKPAVIYT